MAQLLPMDSVTCHLRTHYAGTSLGLMKTAVESRFRFPDQRPGFVSAS